MYCNLQMENNLLYFSVATVVSLATNGVEVREQQNEQSLNNTKDENKRKQGCLGTWLIVTFSFCSISISIKATKQGRNGQGNSRSRKGGVQNHRRPDVVPMKTAKHLHPTQTVSKHMVIDWCKNFFF